MNRNLPKVGRHNSWGTMDDAMIIGVMYWMIELEFLKMLQFQKIGRRMNA